MFRTRVEYEGHCMHIQIYLRLVELGVVFDSVNADLN